MSSSSRVPDPPRVISPSPTPSEISGRDDYFPPTTRSKLAPNGNVERIIDINNELDPEPAHARGRQRSLQLDRQNSPEVTSGGQSTGAEVGMGKSSTTPAATQRHRKDGMDTTSSTLDENANGFLLPTSALGGRLGASYWRSLSRSPSPLGLIPIHREWRAFVHKHEVPRKVLHVSIGFLTLWLYVSGIQLSQVHPILLRLLLPIFTVDVIRFRWPAFNRFYIRSMGAFMRESEAHDRYNGVISYLAGLWFTMRFCRKDVAVMSVLLLSWCDTAASTFGRLWGKYTPRIRRGKSLAGSIAAFIFGVGSSVLFWGIIAHWTDGVYDHGVNSFAFQGTLVLPESLRESLGLTARQARLSGGWALAVMSVISGLVASISEAIDLWSLDDNLTIPVLCGIGLGAILQAIGSPTG